MYQPINTCILLLSLVLMGPGCRNKNYTTTTIRCVTEGCFGSEERALNVYRYRDSTIATLDVNGITVKRVAITEGQIPALSMFQKELKERVAKKEPIVSTTSQTFYLQSGGERTQYQYNSHWDGFDRLTAVLGLEN